MPNRMRLPNFDRAIVPEAKIARYLLSFEHAGGRSKARFFREFGFEPALWQTMRRALLRHAGENEVVSVGDSPFGTRYIVDGSIESPDGRNPLVRTVWFIRSNEDAPRFVTAHPLPRRKR